jgi:hypothetical protein
VYVECKYGTKRLWTFYKQENKESALLLRRVCGSGNILIKTASECRYLIKSYWLCLQLKPGTPVNGTAKKLLV